MPPDTGSAGRPAATDTGTGAHVTVVIPAVDEAERITATISAARALGDRLDHVLVVDGGSGDDTPDLAAAAGAKVLPAADVRPELGPALGKGDSMWRALHHVPSELVAFIDADLDGDVTAYLRDLTDPLLTDPTVDFVKGSFHRVAPDGADPADPFDGGRVTELVARPLLNLWRPDLSHFYQPLGGQVAGRTALLRSLPILTGYAVEIAMLVDVVDRVGADRVTEVDLGTLANRPRPTSDLAPMAQEVLYGFASRVLPPEAQPVWHPYFRPHSPDLATPSTPILQRPPIDP